MKKVPDFVASMGTQARILYERLQLKAKYRDVFLDPTRPVGKEVLHDLLRRTGLLSSSMRGKSDLTAYQEGRRSVGLEILKLLRIGNEAELLNIAMERDEQDKAEEFFNKTFGSTET